MHDVTITVTLTSEKVEHLTAAARRAEAWFGELPARGRGPWTPRSPQAPPAGWRSTTRSTRSRRPCAAVVALEGALRPDARPRARAHREPAAHGDGHRASPAPGRRVCGHARGASSPRRSAPPRRTATGTAAATERSPSRADEEPEDDFDAGFVDEGALEDGFHGADPGAVRRYRFRHPTASGKTIAAAGFVEAARHLGILILTHQPVPTAGPSSTEGMGTASRTATTRASAPRRNRLRRSRPRPGSRGTAQVDRDTYHLVLCDEAHTALGEKTSAAIRVPRAALHRHDRDGAADREAGLGRLPGLRRRPPRSATPPVAA